MAEKEQVCAVVVTYNRKVLLLECLHALLGQTRPIDGICILDNASADGTPELLIQEGYVSEFPSGKINEPWEKTLYIPIPTDKDKQVSIHYIRMHENVGGAGGFYEGLKRAYEKGYGWFWVMDDDAEPEKDSLRIMEQYFSRPELSALVNVKTDGNGGIIYNHVGYFNFQNPVKNIVKSIDLSLFHNDEAEVDFSSFVGIMIKRSAIDKIGLPKKDFFIHHDDVEYCIRLRQAGRLLLLLKSIIKHKAETRNIQAKRTLLGETRRIPYEKLWITYYRRRNLVWLVNKYCKNKLNFLLFYLDLLVVISRKAIGILLFDDNKIRRLQFLLIPYIDGIRGVFDNDKPKTILYR